MNKAYKNIFIAVIPRNKLPESPINNFDGYQLNNKNIIKIKFKKIKI